MEISITATPRIALDHVDTTALRQTILEAVAAERIAPTGAIDALAALLGADGDPFRQALDAGAALRDPAGGLDGLASTLDEMLDAGAVPSGGGGPSGAGGLPGRDAGALFDGPAETASQWFNSTHYPPDPSSGYRHPGPVDGEPWNLITDTSGIQYAVPTDYAGWYTRDDPGVPDGAGTGADELTGDDWYTEQGGYPPDPKSGISHPAPEDGEETTTIRDVHSGEVYEVSKEYGEKYKRDHTPTTDEFGDPVNQNEGSYSPDPDEPAPDDGGSSGNDEADGDEASDEPAEADGEPEGGEDDADGAGEDAPPDDEGEDAMPDTERTPPPDDLAPPDPLEGQTQPGQEEDDGPPPDLEGALAARLAARILVEEDKADTFHFVELHPLGYGETQPGVLEEGGARPDLPLPDEGEVMDATSGEAFVTTHAADDPGWF